MIRYIWFILLLLSSEAFSQRDHQIILDPGMGGDSTFLLSSAISGANKGRGEFRLGTSFCGYGIQWNGSGFKVDTSKLATQHDLTLISGAGDDWGSDVVNHDNTLTGDGTVGTVLKVDTSKIATQYDLTLVGGLSDGDKGDVTVSSSGTVWNIDAGVVGDAETGSIYALLAGRASSQLLNGGTAANEDLTLNGTAHATKTSSYVLLQSTGGNVGIGNTTPAALLDVGTYNTSAYTIRTGTFVLQPYALNNGFIADNAYYNGGWTRVTTGYVSGLQYINGQILMFNATTGSGAFTQTPVFKSDYANSGTVALGGNISQTSGDYTGSKMVVLGTGNVGIGTTAPASLFNVSGTPVATANYGMVSIGGGAWDGVTSGFFTGTSTGAVFAINGTNSTSFNLVDIQRAGSRKFLINSRGAITVTPTGVNGGEPTFSLTPATQSSITAEFNNLLFAANQATITGSYATQRFNLFNQQTITAGSALTVTNASNFVINGAPKAAGSALITTSSALRIDAGASLTSAVTTGYGLYVDPPTGAGTNYAALFNGAVNITSSLQCDAVVNDTGLAAGTFTPTRSAEANLDANVTTTEGQYMRVGNTVTFSGRITNVDPTLTATITTFEITLPVASNIGAIEDLAGTAVCGSIAGMSIEIFGSVANNTAVFKLISTDITAQSISYTITYQVI